MISFFHLSVKLYFTLLFNRKTYTNLLIFVLFVCSFFLLFNLSSFIRFSMITRLNFTLVKLNQNNFCQTSSFLALWRTKLFVCFYQLFVGLVGTSGLEPPTSRLSGARSNHLSYAPLCGYSRGSPHVPLVEMMGIEPMTPCLQGRCSPS